VSRLSVPVALLCLGVLTACSAQIPGQGRPAPFSTGTPTPTTATPTPPPRFGPGTVTESHRIAGAVVLVGQLLPHLVETCTPSGPFVNPEETEGAGGLFIAGTAVPTLTQYGFVAGWASCQTAPDVRASTVFVAEMSDPDSAAAAADALAGSLAVEGYEAGELPDAPDARVLSLERTADQDGEDSVSLQILVPMERMLVYVFHADVDAEQAAQNATLVLAEQAELLADFTPTPQPRVPALNPDPFNLARRVIDTPGEETNYTGSYDLDSYLRVALAPDTEQQILMANGFVGTYLNQSNDVDGLGYQAVVYEFGSLPEADAAYQAFRGIEETEFDNRTTFVVPELPTTPCYYFPAAEGSDVLYQRCYVRVRTYLGSVDVYGVTDPLDTGQIRMLLRSQRTAMDN